MPSSRLIIMRHAQTEPTAPDSDDVGRALTPRGSADALALGAWLHEHQPELPQIVSSTALRARQTVAAAIVPWGDTPPATRWEPELYLASLETLLNVVAAVRETTTLLVGHNPGLEDLLRYLVSDPEHHPALGDSAANLMPAGAIYILELPTGRGQPAAGVAELRAHVRPEFLAAEHAADGAASDQR